MVLCVFQNLTNFWFLRNKSYNIQKYKEEANKENKQHIHPSQEFTELTPEDTEMQKLVTEEQASVDP